MVKQTLIGGLTWLIEVTGNNLPAGELYKLLAEVGMPIEMDIITEAKSEIARLTKSPWLMPSDSLKFGRQYASAALRIRKKKFDRVPANKQLMPLYFRIVPQSPQKEKEYARELHQFIANPFRTNRELQNILPALAAALDEKDSKKDYSRERRNAYRAAIKEDPSLVARIQLALRHRVRVTRLRRTMAMDQITLKNMGLGGVTSAEVDEAKQLHARKKRMRDIIAGAVHRYRARKGS